MMTKRERFRAACARVYIYTLDRLKEPATLRGLAMLLGGSAAAADVARLDRIVMVTMLIVGALGALLPDKLRREAQRGKEE